MASDVEIVNVALTLLGEDRIASLDDDTKPARESKALFAINRDALMAGYNWSFAKTRSQLSALASAPAFQYALKYQLPSECIRIIQIGDFYAGLDLTDYRGSQTEMFTVEGREILTDLSAPLNFRFVQRVTDTAQFSANFAKAFAAYMAVDLAEPLTQSDTKRGRAVDSLKREISMAIRANAIELPPQKFADDEWLISRL